MRNDSIVIRVPVKLVRRNGRKLVFTPDGIAPPRMNPEPDDFIISAVLRAHLWNKALENGKARSVAELARKEGMNESYLARVLRLCLLAPDIKQSILDGHHPKGLRLIDMLKPFPLMWDEQRRWFGFVGYAETDENLVKRSKVSSSSASSPKSRAGASSSNSNSEIVMS